MANINPLTLKERAVLDAAIEGIEREERRLRSLADDREVPGWFDTIAFVAADHLSAARREMEKLITIGVT